MEHQTIEPKDLRSSEGPSEAQRHELPKHAEHLTFRDRIWIRILEVSTLELIVATGHLVLFFCVVFFGIGKGGHS